MPKGDISNSSGVYRIINSVTGEQYVGSALCLRKRWNSHKARLNNNNHHTPALQSAWCQYGEDAFEFSVLLVCRPIDLIVYEQIVIDALHPAYNVRSVARSNLGVKYSAESRAKLSAALKGNRNTLGYKHTLEARANMSAAKMGQQPMLGKKQSPETRAKIAAKHIGKKLSPESRAKLSLAKKGVPVSPEVMARRMERYALKRIARNVGTAS